MLPAAVAKNLWKCIGWKMASYVLEHSNPVWLPEIGLGIGRERGTYTARSREWLYWYDNTSKRIPTAEERAERLAAKLRELGVNPDEI